MLAPSVPEAMLPANEPAKRGFAEEEREHGSRTPCHAMRLEPDLSKITVIKPSVSAFITDGEGRVLLGGGPTATSGACRADRSRSARR